MPPNLTSVGCPRADPPAPVGVEVEPAAGSAGGPGDLVLPRARGDQGSGRARRRRGQPVAGCRRRCSACLPPSSTRSRATSSSTPPPRPPRRRSTPASSMTRSTCHRSTRRPDVGPTAGSWSSPHSTVRSVPVTGSRHTGSRWAWTCPVSAARRDLATRSRRRFSRAPPVVVSSSTAGRPRMPRRGARREALASRWVQVRVPGASHKAKHIRGLRRPAPLRRPG